MSEVVAWVSFKDSSPFVGYSSVNVSLARDGDLSDSVNSLRDSDLPFFETKHLRKRI